ncbi:MAG: hypothetical protein ACU841_09840 [Gammaproteobacteria bacterium]
MKLIFLGLTMALSLFAGAASATEYIYRDLMANTLPSPGCTAESDAVQKAIKPYNINNYSKRFCQTQGYGWHVSEIKDNGKAVCEDCSGNGLKKCHVEDIVVTCKRIKPGSVGMLPGKG